MIPYDSDYAAIAQHLGYRALVLQRGLAPESARDFIKCMGEQNAVETIDNTLMNVVETHILWQATPEQAIKMDTCARRHMGQILSSLDYSNEEKGESLGLPSIKNAANILLKRFYLLLENEYKLPKIERLYDQ